MQQCFKYACSCIFFHLPIRCVYMCECVYASNQPLALTLRLKQCKLCQENDLAVVVAFFPYLLKSSVCAHSPSWSDWFPFCLFWNLSNGVLNIRKAASCTAGSSLLSLPQPSLKASFPLLSSLTLCSFSSPSSLLCCYRPQWLSFRVWGALVIRT